MSEAVVDNCACVEGFYRQTKTGETSYYKIGEPFLERPDGRWLCMKSDNIKEEDTILLMVDTLLHAVETDELPEVGVLMNFASSAGVLHGLYKITEIVDENFVFGEESYIKISVEHVGDWDSSLMIHFAGQCIC